MICRRDYGEPRLPLSLRFAFIISSCRHACRFAYIDTPLRHYDFILLLHRPRHHACRHAIELSRRFTLR